VAFLVPWAITAANGALKLWVASANVSRQQALLDIQIPSNAGPPAHIHSREDEATPL